MTRSTVNVDESLGRRGFRSVIAQFEREMMLERQREGIDKAQKAGKYKGRKPIHEEKRAAILRLAGEGVTKVEIAKQLNLGQATVYRELANARALSTECAAAQ